MPVFIALFCLTACAPRIAGSVPERQTEEKTDLSAPKEPARLDDAGRAGLLERLKNHPDARVAALGEGAFLDWLEERFGPERLIALADRAQSGELSSETFYELMGNTAAVLFDLYYGLPDNVRLCESPRLGACIRVVGDVSFADNWKIIPVLEEKGEGIEGVVSPEALSLLRSSDVTLVNNEFTYSTRGAPLANKAYTFRADPDRVSLMKELGADLVSLANNHAYDYGELAFADTLQTLQDADLPYIGGGEDLAEASRPFYFIINGRKYAFSAATRAEKYILTPEATETSSGVLRTYDPAAYLDVIAEAERNCDTNLVFVHWGTEDSHATEVGLYELAERYIAAGADVVIGAHAHVLQGIDYGHNVPIVYNLGNFLFNAETVETGILDLQFDERGALSTRLIPCLQENCTVRTVSGADAKRVLDLMRSLSPNAVFDESGAFREKTGS